MAWLEVRVCPHLHQREGLDGPSVVRAVLSGFAKGKQLAAARAPAGTPLLVDVRPGPSPARGCPIPLPHPIQRTPLPRTPHPHANAERSGALDRGWLPPPSRCLQGGIVLSVLSDAPEPEAHAIVLLAAQFLVRRAAAAAPRASHGSARPVRAQRRL